MVSYVLSGLICAQFFRDMISDQQIPAVWDEIMLKAPPGKWIYK